MRTWFVLTILCCCAPLRADDAPDAIDEDDMPPGLVAQYSAGDKSIERIDRDVQFIWGPNSPDSRLPGDAFEATWTGKLRVPEAGRYELQFLLQGEVTLVLDGWKIQSPILDKPKWFEALKQELEPGEHDLKISYRKVTPEGVLRLFWSSEHFPLEPVPTRHLFHDTPRRELQQLERGGELFDALRCNRCHKPTHELPSPRAPSLTQAASGLSRDWLAEWLVEAGRSESHARMPGFGFGGEEARAITAFLLSQPAEALNDRPERASPPDASRRGEILFRSLGCLACHVRGELGARSNPIGGDLTDIGRKRTPGWLDSWLIDPSTRNEDHQMPVFPLSDDERHDLVTYLSGRPSADEPPVRKEGTAPDGELVDIGKKLVAAARCVACHRIENLPAELTRVPSLETGVGDWSKACSEAAPDRTRWRPGYALSAFDRQALRAFVESLPGRLMEEGPFAQGAKLLQQKGCLNCHARDGLDGIGPVARRVGEVDPDFRGRTETLIPPDLTAVGDKLKDEHLNTAMAGLQKVPRLPWLRVRMPRFARTHDERERILAFLIGHDRFESTSGGTENQSRSRASFTEQELGDLSPAGRMLLGARGFACGACHQIGKHAPRNVAQATRGSDLYRIGERMRPEYFARWVRSPLRVVPGMEMPSFSKPHPDVLSHGPNRLEGQLAIMWHVLNDPQGPPRIDASTIEQIITPTAGTGARIVRDVFTFGDVVRSEHVPRAFAIGFEHSKRSEATQNLLFDLDSMELKEHWSGDFARQRASGKSWDWEPAGSGFERSYRGTPDLVLYRKDDPEHKPIVAQRASGRFGRLLKYEQHGNKVTLHYKLRFLLDEMPVDLIVTDSFQAAVERYSRRLEVAGVPDRVDVELLESLTHLDKMGWENLARSNLPKSPHRFAVNRSTGIARYAEGGWTAREPHSAGAVDVTGGDVRNSGQRDGAPAITVTPPPVWTSERIDSVPGYDGVRLPLPWSIMPTAITWTEAGTLAFCSLKGHVYLAKDTDGDGIEDALTLFEEGLAAPFGLIADGRDLIVAHKPELLRLRDTDGDGKADLREVFADGWGFTEDYHDWTTGIARDSQGRLYVGTGSDYTKPGRDPEKSRWRGKVLRVDKDGRTTPLGHAFRYPTGLAITPDDQVFVTDNQGLQNTFNEINHLVAGGRYGVPSLYEEPHEGPTRAPAIQVPHPWTRSVNGIFFLPRESDRSGRSGNETQQNDNSENGSETAKAAHPFAGHGIGCEYDGRFLVRFTLQRVGETFQGAVYPFSRSPGIDATGQLRGTICGSAAPNGDILIGSFLDSGWQGGGNVGDIVRLRFRGPIPCGIREIVAYDGAFVITFTAPIDREAAALSENYNIFGYTRVWQGTYATADSGRHELVVRAIDVAADGLAVTLHTNGQQAGHVYEINCGRIGTDRNVALWPAVGHYTMNRIPARPGD